jgi:MSHA biogenesis protein MshL
MKKFLSLFLLATTAFAADQPMLEHAIGPLRFEKTPIAVALRLIGHACDATVLAAPDVTGEVTLEIPAGTLRAALSAVTAPPSYYFEETSAGIIVRRLRTILYTIDYPQLSRSGSGSASVTLGGANGSSGGNGNGSTGLPGTTTASGLNGLNGTNGTTSDATQVSISQDNPSTFWSTLEGELRAMLKDGDGLVLNKFSGVLQVTATLPRQENIRAFLTLVNRRITQQVEIEARLVEVTLRDQQKLGIDWDLASGSLGRGTVSASAPLDVTDVGGTLLSATTFKANLGLGRVSAVIQALKQQGDLRTVAQPRLRALNNQTAFIKVGSDQPFFRLQQSTTFQQAGTTVPVNQTQDQYSVSTITIGTILAVTPQIDDHGVITLDVLPAITRLQAVVTSPDGRQTAPLTDVKQASTIVRLRDGETAVIGGLISEETGDTTNSIPVLGAVPVLGAAFRTKGKLHNRTELVIFLTPHLIR